MRHSAPAAALRLVLEHLSKFAVKRLTTPPPRAFGSAGEPNRAESVSKWVVSRCCSRITSRHGVGCGWRCAEKRDICAEAENAEQAIRAAKREQPEVCLVGRGISGDGIRATRGICRAAPKAAVVLIADAIDTDDLLDAVRAGAVGYVAAHDLHAAGLRRIVRAAADSEAIVPRATPEAAG